MRILIDMPVHAEHLEVLRSLPGVHVDVVPYSEGNHTLPAALLSQADALFCQMPPSNVDEARQLRWIQISSAGYSQLFGLDLPGRGVQATNARGCFDVPIAEWNIAMMINLARDLRQMIRNQDVAVWDRGARFQTEIRGATVGLWGYGGIGRETARLARGLGLRVHVFSRSGIGPIGDVYAEPGTGDPKGILPTAVFLAERRQEFLASVDFLILAMPLTPETEGIIGEEDLRALKPTAYVLNPSRGPLIQEEPLLRGLREHWFAGAALDTHYAYPLPPEHPLWSLPNVILTPHISGSSLNPHYLDRIWGILLENTRRMLGGTPLLNEIAPEQLRF